MEAANDIALGEISTAELSDLIGNDSLDEYSHRRQKSFRGLRLSFVLSACIHLVLASTALYFIADDLQTEEDIVPATFRVEFVSSNPLLAQAEQNNSESISEATADPLETSSPIPSEAVVTTTQVPEQRQLESVELDIPDVVEVEVAEVGSTDRPSLEVEAITIPSVDSVQSAITAVRRSETSQFYSYDCNKIEQEKAFNNCAPSDVRDYSRATKNTVYDFYNPAVGISRSREAVTTLASQSGNVSTALELRNLPAGLAAFVLEEIEQGIETYSNNSNRVVSHMSTMLDKSYAGAQARRVFDHWVVQQSAVINSRRVENRTDVAFED